MRNSAARRFLARKRIVALRLVTKRSNDSILFGGFQNIFRVVSTANWLEHARREIAKHSTELSHATANGRRHEVISSSGSVAATVTDPAGLCRQCASGQWQLPRHTWRCRACSPGMPLSATTLALPCYKVYAGLHAHARPHALSETADKAADTSCQSVLAMLAESPDITHTITSDTESEPDAVIVTLAIRGQAKLHMAKDR